MIPKYKKTWQKGSSLRDYISIMGYKRTSPFVDEERLFINTPNGRITMKDVDFPILGISEKGEAKIMFPQEEHKFKGKNILEIPIKNNKLFLDLDGTYFVIDENDKEDNKEHDNLLDKRYSVRKKFNEHLRKLLFDIEQNNKMFLEKDELLRNNRNHLVSPTKMCDRKVKKKMISGGKVAGKSPENFLNDYNKQQTKDAAIGEVIGTTGALVSDMILPGSGQIIKGTIDVLSKGRLALQNYINRDKIKSAKQLINRNELYDSASNFENKYKDTLGYV